MTDLPKLPRMPRMSFPESADLIACSSWCEPLHMVERAIVHHPDAKYFRIEDFMCMGKLHRRGRPDLILNKHVFTRRYLNLDADGHAYRYIASRSLDSSSTGRYRRHLSLADAIDHLLLFEMPWIGGSGFEPSSGWDGDR